MTETEKKCSNCDFCVLQDFGYSNYTVEGTEVYCSNGLNPAAPFDRWYGADSRDEFAKTCSAFQHTVGPVSIDCDFEDGSFEAYSNGVISGSDIKGAIN